MPTGGTTDKFKDKHEIDIKNSGSNFTPTEDEFLIKDSMWPLEINFKHMKFNYGICLLTIALLTCNTASNTHNKIVAATPNIIIILSDDMGYADIGCHGGEIGTPVKSSQINPSECLKDE